MIGDCDRAIRPISKLRAQEPADRRLVPRQRLQALTLFDWLCERFPGRFEAGQVRTLQRRVRDWRAQHGPDLEVYSRWL
jgi:hypothetical protein